MHRIRSRGQEDDIHLDLHIRVDPGITVEQGHYVAHQVQRRLMDKIEGLRDVVVHAEPQESRNGEGQDLGVQIRQIAQRIPDTSVHSVQAREVNGRLFATLHLEVGDSIAMDQAHAMADRVEAMLREEIPRVADVDVHIEPGRESDDRASPVDLATYQRVRQTLDEATSAVKGLGACHDARVFHQAESLLVSGHWECDPALTVDDAHVLSQELEGQIRMRLPEATEVVIHVEPADS